MTFEGKIDVAQAQASDGSMYDRVMGKTADTGPATDRNAVKVVTDPPVDSTRVVGDPTRVVSGPVGDPVGTGRTENQRDCNWRPDYEMKSESAKRWNQSFQQRRNLPIEVNANGQYVVVYGDDLNSIASRSLRSRSIQPTRAAINQEMAQIVALNADRYPSLRCNQELIKTGWKLNLPDGSQAPPRQPDSAEVPPVVHKPVDPAAGREVVKQGGKTTVYNIDADQVYIRNGVVQENLPPQVVQRSPVIMQREPIGPYYSEGPPVMAPPSRTRIMIGGNPQWSGPQYYPEYDPGYSRYEPGWQQRGGCFGTGNRIGVNIGAQLLGQFLPHHSGGYHGDMNMMNMMRRCNRGQQWAQGGPHWGNQRFNNRGPRFGISIRI